MIPLESILLVFTAITSCIAAVTGILKLRRNIELPAIAARTINRPENSELESREIQFEQLTNPSVWIVNEVRTSTFGRRWLCKIGEPVRNSIGMFIGYKLESEWVSRLTFDPPVQDGGFLLHPEAPEKLTLSFTVALRGRPRVRRRVRVFLE